MKEIGGYFGIEIYNKKNKYYKESVDLNYARNCLEIIIRKRNIKEIYLPIYLCNSVKEKCTELNCKIIYYHIKRDFTPDLTDINEEAYIYIVNYYGFFDEKKIVELKEKYKRVIVDNAQAFFRKPVNNVDIIYSYRKFFGVPDGACLISNLRVDDNMNRQNVSDIIYYLVGREEKTASEYYKDFHKSEIAIKDKKIKKISLYSENVLNAINYEEIKDIRKNNFEILHNELKVKNQLKINGILYYMYPFLLNDKTDIIRKKLIQNNIYIPKLWPNIKTEELSEIENEYINNILPIPIDQRYNENDMKKIIEIILNN